MTSRDVSRLRRGLLERRKEILELRENLNACLYDFQFHDAEREDVAQDLFRLDGREKDEIEAIDRALQKMDKGVYSICESCGGAIALTRLEALPATPVCFACATSGDERRTDAPSLNPGGAAGTGSAPMKWGRVVDDQFLKVIHSRLLNDGHR